MSQWRQERQGGDRVETGVLIEPVEAGETGETAVLIETVETVD